MHLLPVNKEGQRGRRWGGCTITLERGGSLKIENALFSSQFHLTVSVVILPASDLCI